ncbi:MAG: extracellular solute-binding protein [Melioribacteraceae bacterium]|nr:extracellular solute-binding protein [Melioribacteraceae bacterium]
MIEKLKKYFKTFYFYVALITILAVAVLGFMFFWGNGLFQPVRIPEKIFYADNISPTHKLLIDKFNQLNKGRIEVIPIDLPFEKFSTNERKELLIRYLRSKSDKIDIFSVDQIWIPRFAKWTEPLNKYFITPERETIINEALKTCYYKNDLVAVPLYFDISFLYYNDELLKKLPNYNQIKNELENGITWGKFFELSNQLKIMNKPIYLFPADNYEGLMCSFFELLESLNEKIFVGDTVRLNTPATRKSLQLLVDLIDKKITPKDVLEFRETECYRKYVLENGFFLRGWSGLDVWYKNNIDSVDVSNKFIPTFVPHFNDTKPTSISGGWNLMLSKNSTKKSESIEFIKFLLSEESQKILFEKGGYLPVNSKVYQDTNYVSNRNLLNKYKKIIKTVAYRPLLEKYTRVSDVIAYYLKEALQKKIKVEDALIMAERSINSKEIFFR